MMKLIKMNCWCTGGGGNFVGIYKNCASFLKKNKNFNEIILLPHTVNNEDELIRSFNDNIKIICREKKSYFYVYNTIKNKNNVFLAHDMAFSLEYPEKFDQNYGKKILNCFRNDAEGTSIHIPRDNLDISTALLKNLNISDETSIKNHAESFLLYIASYEVVKTNRLHVAIAASLLSKIVMFYPNSYYKNKEVYEYSLKDKYKNTFFIEKDDL